MLRCDKEDSTKVGGCANQTEMTSEKLDCILHE